MVTPQDQMALRRLRPFSSRYQSSVGSKLLAFDRLRQTRKIFAEKLCQSHPDDVSHFLSFEEIRRYCRETMTSMSRALFIQVHCSHLNCFTHRQNPSVTIVETSRPVQHLLSDYSSMQFQLQLDRDSTVATVEDEDTKENVTNKK